MNFFNGKWNSLTLFEQALLRNLLEVAKNQTVPHGDAQLSIVKLLDDILSRIEYLERTRHYHDPKG